MIINLIKCHGSGNDFLLIDELSNDYHFTEEQRITLAKALCNRESLLGADGVLFVLKSNKADAMMRVFNSDGSEASMCGNGLRCVARYVCELMNKNEAIIETMKADLKVSSQEEIYQGVPTYQVEISPVSFKLSDLPLHIEQEQLINEMLLPVHENLLFTALAVPNPHLVSIVGEQDIRSNLQKEISQSLNKKNNLFPDGVNVSFINLIKENQIYVRTYERGVGFTNACGTAMSASSLVTCLLGHNKIGDTIEVFNNGGKVHCVVHNENAQYTINLIGNATYLFAATVSLDISIPNRFTIDEKELYGEEVSYKKLQEYASSVVTEALN